MKKTIIYLFLMLASFQWTEAQLQENNTEVLQPSVKEKEIIRLSSEKWTWMAERDIENLEGLFHEKAVFVHMGGTMKRDQELEIIRSGGIQYKRAEIHDVSVNILGKTAVLLNRITLLAIVGGNEVTNPFMVTEVYIKEGKSWKLASLSFTRLLNPS